MPEEDGQEILVRFRPADMKLVHDGEQWYVSIADLLGNIAMLRTEIEHSVSKNSTVVKSMTNAMDGIVSMIVGARDQGETEKDS
jgi:hypothetical protein